VKDTTTSKETVGRSVIHECPNCFNDMYITYFRLLCEKCGFGAKIPYHILYDKFELDKSKELAIKNEIFRQLKSKYDFSKQTFTDSPNSRKHTTTIKGEVLEFIEGISNEYGLKSNDKALSFVISSFYILKKFIAGLNGRKVYLIDEQGNRSPNFIPAVFSKFEDIFFHSQDRESVRDLIECLEDGLSLEEQKKRMEGSKEEKGDE
jgi:hypothetical protein